MILAGDIGGTRARLALYDGAKGKPIRHDTFESRAYTSLEAVVRGVVKPLVAFNRLRILQRLGLRL